MQNVPALHFVERENFFFGWFLCVRQVLCRVMRQKSCAVRFSRNRNKVDWLSDRILSRLFDVFNFFNFFTNYVVLAVFQVRNSHRLFAGFYLNLFRKVLKLDYAAFRKYDGMFHDVFEFADVAGVGVLRECIKSRRFQVVDFLALRFLVL